MFFRDGIVTSITVTRVSLSVGGLPLEAQGRLHLTAQDAKENSSQLGWDGWLTLEHPFFKGMVELSGTVKEPILLGWMEPLAEARDFPRLAAGAARNVEEGAHFPRSHFVSQWSLSREAIRLKQAELQGAWRVEGVLKKEVSSHGVGGRITIWARQEEEIPEQLTVRWVVERSDLHLQAELLGQEASLNGRIRLKPPYPVDLNLELKRADLDRWIRWFAGPQRWTLSGPIHGRVTLTGPLSQLESQGQISSEGGSLGWERFRLATLRFRGEGPILKIQNSQITKPSGVLLIEGTVDLRRLGRSDFLSNVRLSSTERSLGVGGGWRVGPLGVESPARPVEVPGERPSVSGLSVRRSTAEDRMAVGLAYEVDREVQPESVTREELELTYPLSSSGQRVQVRLDRDEEFVGVEHRKKF